MTEQAASAGRPPHQQYEQRKLKIRALRYILVLIVIAVCLAIWGILSRLHTRSELHKMSDNDSLITVVTAKPELSAAGDELVLPGLVQAYMEAPIYARTAGYVKSWRTDIGAHVKKGQSLAEIETPEVDRQLSQARADLATAQANLNLARTTNERWKRLLATQSVSKQDADEKAGDAAAKAAIVDSAAENVARLRDLKSFKHVLAPFSGVVTARNTDVGNLINPGQSSGAELFRIADTHKLRVYAQVPEAYADATTAGLPAELRFAEHPGKSYSADTVRTSNALDPTARTLQVELQLDNRDGELFPGAYAEVHFKLPDGTRTLRLPSNVILFRDGLQVAVVDRDHKIKLKTVTQGRDFGKTIEILSGLDGADAVVVNPAGFDRGRSAGPHCTAAAEGRSAAQTNVKPRFATRPWYLAAYATCAVLAGCSFAPPYKEPAVTAAPDHYQEGIDWKLAQPNDSGAKGSWWLAFEDSQLTAFENQVGDANQNLKAAFARLQQARADTRIARADLFPNLSASGSATRGRVSPNSPRFLAGSPHHGQRLCLGG